MSTNRYGAIAQRHRARWLPRQYAAIGDPGTFTTLGEEVAQQIEELTDELMGEIGQGEGYLAQVGRLFAGALSRRSSSCPSASCQILSTDIENWLWHKDRELATVRGLRAEQDSLAQEIEVGAAEHLAFKGLDAADVPFDGAAAIGQDEPGFPASRRVVLLAWPLSRGTRRPA